MIGSEPQAIVRRLELAGCVAASEEAEELVAAAAGDRERLERMVSRRVCGEPLAWITGSVLFCGFRVLVHRDVYVPRWQSEPLVRRAAELVGEGGRAVDLCTGSGALAVALARLAPRCDVVATEIDPVAVRCARANGVRVFMGNLDEPVPSAFVGSTDVVIAVVPYVPTAEMAYLPRDVRDYEPLRAIDGGELGVDVLLAAVSGAARLLRLGGTLLLELGGDQVDLLEEQLSRLGYGDLRRLFDEDDDARGLEAIRLP